MTNDKGRRFVKAGCREDRKFGICARKPVHRAIGADCDISVYIEHAEWKRNKEAERKRKLLDRGDKQWRNRSIVWAERKCTMQSGASSLLIPSEIG